MRASGGVRPAWPSCGDTVSRQSSRDTHRTWSPQETAVPLEGEPISTGLRPADAGAAAQLLSYGLQPRLRPASTAGYADLVARHQSDVGFRELVDDIADGLGLIVLEADGVSGVVLAPAPGSVFEARLADYRTNLSGDDRLIHGLIHVGIAAYAFPTPSSLADDDVRHASVVAVERFLRTACERLHDRHRDAAPDDVTETEQAWRLYLRRQATRDTADGRVGVSTTVGMVKYAFERLVAGGMATRTATTDGGTYRLLRRYRTGVRELGATAAYRELMEAMRA